MSHSKLKFLSLSLLISSCATPPPSPESIKPQATVPAQAVAPIPPPSPLPVATSPYSGRAPLKGFPNEYVAYIALHMPPELTKLDLQSICGKKPQNPASSINRIIHAISYAESQYQRTMRYVEKGIPQKDMVTGLANTSEGLMQVSQQDSKLWGCDFRWDLDKKLSPTDPNKTIFNPYRNLGCSLLILSGIKERLGGSTFQVVGAKYWSTLRPSNKSGYSNFLWKLKDLGGCI